MLLLKNIYKEYYTQNEAIPSLIQYADKIAPNTATYTAGINCSPYANEAIAQFQMISTFFKKNPAQKIRHFEISSDTIKNPLEMLQLAYRVGLYYLNRYQVFIGVHNNTDYIHAHFILNTVSCYDGIIYSYSQEELSRFMNYIRSLGYSIQTVNSIL